MFHKSSSKLELTGSLVALACAVHCLAIPLLLSIGSFGVVEIFEHRSVEIGFLICTLILAGGSLYQSFRNSSFRGIPIALFIVGFICLFISVFIHNHVLSAVGGILLASAHIYNWYQLRRLKTA